MIMQTVRVLINKRLELLQMTNTLLWNRIQLTYEWH